MAKLKYPRNDKGIPFGAFVLANGMPARVAGASNERTTFVEVWGFSHESGSEYTCNCRRVDQSTWRKAMVGYGYSPEDKPYSEKLIKWDNENPTTLTD